VRPRFRWAWPCLPSPWFLLINRDREGCSWLSQRGTENGYARSYRVMRSIWIVS